MNMRLVTLIIATLLVSASSHAGLPALVRVKQNERAANGLCLPAFPNDQTPDQILARNKIHARTKNGDDLPHAVKRALAHVVSTMEDLGDGRFKAHQGVHMIFRPEMGYSELVNSTTLYIRPGNENMMAMHDTSHGGVCNKGMLAHEIAHYVSLNDRRIQQAYEEAVPSPCYVTRYAAHNRVEEFAEVFATYLTNPDLFKGKGPHCDRARRVMASMFREHPDHSLSCDSRARSIVNPGTPANNKKALGAK